MRRQLEDLLDDTRQQEFHGELDQVITGISYDSRSIEPGEAFIAISGQETDGHEFIPDAINNGARVVFGEKPRAELSVSPPTYVQTKNTRKSLARLSHSFFGKPTSKLYTVGVTGTNGKSTTVHLTRSILGEQKTEMVSTITNKDIPGTVKPVTTPEAPKIHEIAQGALEKGKENIVLEVSSHSLSMERVAAIDFNCGVFTNLTRDHLDYHKSMEEYKQEKLKLFTYLSHRGTAIINGDDKFSVEIANVTDGEVITYGLDKSSDVYATNLEVSRDESEFTVFSPWGSKRMKTNLFGEYNVYNALAATTVGLSGEIDLTKIGQGLELANGVPGRMEKLELNNGADVYIDFAHNSGALAKTLRELSQFYQSTSVVFGCGGDSDRGKRPEMGRIASKYGDRIFLTDDNPKKEDRMNILREIERGIKENSNYSIIPDRKEAIETAIDELSPDSCLLIAGKGHEQFQVVKGRWINYNDKDFVEEICRKKTLIQ